ncbi:MAG: hypothetical protein OES53_11775, partial [Xanthomonadales bacterium]|nr:hypothetical protein [Xanthomonadales bacterium]
MRIEPTFMHQAMMSSAQEYQVIHAGFAAVSPMPDVVCVNKFAAGTTREAATAIPSLECAPYGWWNSPGFAA